MRSTEEWKRAAMDKRSLWRAMHKSVDSLLIGRLTTSCPQTIVIKCNLCRINIIIKAAVAASFAIMNTV